MKEIVISIRPEWVAKILNGEKTIEIRKTMSKCELPAKVYIYCTKNKSKKDELIYVKDPLNQANPFYVLGNEYGHKVNLNGKVVAEFTLNNIDDFRVFDNGTIQYWAAYNLENACLAYDKLSEYIGKCGIGYAWHIEDLKVYDIPKSLNDFNLTKAPQSWCYVKSK